MQTTTHTNCQQGMHVDIKYIENYLNGALDIVARDLAVNREHLTQVGERAEAENLKQGRIVSKICPAHDYPPKTPAHLIELGFVRAPLRLACCIQSLRIVLCLLHVHLVTGTATTTSILRLVTQPTHTPKIREQNLKHTSVFSLRPP